MAQRHPWTHVKDADIPRLDAEVHDAELLKLAIRPKLLRLELQLSLADVAQCPVVILL